MVTVADHQALLADCKQWLENLRQHREMIHQLHNELYSAAAGKTDKDFLKEVEHYHNQFHIQQINIHDLKHEIKHHIHEAELHPNFGHKIPHHNIELSYNTLIRDIDKLAADFKLFIGGQ
jgi:hypothetical protein